MNVHPEENPSTLTRKIRAAGAGTRLEPGRICPHGPTQPPDGADHPARGQPPAAQRHRQRCARALNLPVSDLLHLPLDRLLPRMRNSHAYRNDDALKKLYEQATHAELRPGSSSNTERAKLLKDDEIVELVSQQGPDGPLSQLGVDHCVSLIEHKRRLFEQVRTIAGTEYLDLLEKMVTLIYEKVQPYRDGNP